MQQRRRPPGPVFFQIPLIWRKAFPAARRTGFGKGQIVTEKSHEPDEFR